MAWPSLLPSLFAIRALKRISLMIKVKEKYYLLLFLYSYAVFDSMFILATSIGNGRMDSLQHKYLSKYFSCTL